MPENFSFVIPQKLAGSAAPGVWRSLESDLQQYRQAGISAIISLTEQPLPREVVARAGFDYLHEAIEDFMPPTPAQFNRINDFIKKRLSGEQGAVVVHCRAGIGRTGTVLAGYLISLGLPAEEAVDQVRDARPGSIETEEQVSSLLEFEVQLRAGES